jgi:DNA polymerase-1
VEHKNEALLGKELVAINTDIPIELSIENLEWKGLGADEVRIMLEGFGFSSLLKRLQENGTTSRKQGQLKMVEKQETSDTTLGKIEGLYREQVFSKEIYELEKSLMPILRAMEKTGIKVDKPYFQKLSQEMEKELLSLRTKIHEKAGKEFNINSTQQISEVLFGDLGLSPKGLKKTPKGVISTASPELEKLRGVHPIVEEIFKHREIQKLLTTYARPLPELADAKDRVHTHFDQLGAATGRLSSAEPNLQNIPNQGEWGKRIRRGFISDHGFSLVSFDYSQMELRIAAHLSGDEQMCAFFRAGADIHTMTASTVFGVSDKEVTPEMRFRAKALNFGVLYGMGAQGFAKSAGIPVDEARDFIEQYFVRFPKVFEYMEQTKEFARSHGYVETMFGRKRYLPEVNSSTPQLRAASERMAVNHPIQGSLADLVKMAMVKIQQSGALPDTQGSMLLQIHDELLFEIADGIVEETSRSIKELMEKIVELNIPVRVDIKKGKNWADVEKILFGLPCGQKTDTVE